MGKQAVNKITKNKVKGKASVNKVKPVQAVAVVFKNNPKIKPGNVFETKFKKDLVLSKDEKFINVVISEA